MFGHQGETFVKRSHLFKTILIIFLGCVRSTWADEVEYDAVLDVAASAEEQPAKPQTRGTHIESANSVRINYAYAEWNKNSTKFDSGSLIMREGNTGRLIQIHLEESEPDSSRFSGLYQLSFQNMERLKVEFYVPPQKFLETIEGMKKVNAMITSGQLQRRPFILRRTPQGAQTVEIFDTREQAQLALKVYRNEQQVQGIGNVKYPSDQQVDLAKQTAEMKAKAAAAAAEAERLRVAQLEAQKLAALLAKQAALDAAEKERRKKQAEKLSAEAFKLFQDGKLQEATDAFAKALEFDPDNHAYYFQYGVALYKLEKTDKSITYLSLADGPQVNAAEKNFYLGLNHFKLKAYDRALESFDKVIETKNPELSASATFYKGIIHFEKKDWIPARDAFQKVLDTSSDKALDQRAEQYIELILRTQQFETERKRKWQFTSTFGEQYDSNVTLASDSSLSQGSATNVAGYRSMFMGSGRYRPIYDEWHEFATQLDLVYMYTVDQSFSYVQSLANADPLVASLTAPWAYKGLLFGKGYKLDVIPGYESITMSADGNVSKEIIHSYVLNITNLVVMHERLFSNFNMEVRRDQNEISSLTGDNDSTAVKVKLVYSNLHMIPEKKGSMYTSEADVTFNQAEGKNASYNRLDLSVGYIRPFYWDTSATLKFAYYWLNYPLKSDNRTDSDYTFTAGLSKKLNDTYSTGFISTYAINNSSADASTYKKWTAMVTLSALTAF